MPQSQRLQTIINQVKATPNVKPNRAFLDGVYLEFQGRKATNKEFERFKNSTIRDTLNIVAGREIIASTEPRQQQTPRTAEQLFTPKQQQELAIAKQRQIEDKATPADRRNLEFAKERGFVPEEPFRRSREELDVLFEHYLGRMASDKEEEIYATAPQERLISDLQNARENAQKRIIGEDEAPGMPEKEKPMGAPELTIPEIVLKLPPELQELYSTLKDYLDELKSRGETINPEIEITQAQVAEFTKQAEREISPFFKEQLQLARSNFLRELGFTTSEIERQEEELERRFGRQLETIGESVAERGLALSGRRLKSEQELAEETQRQIEDARRRAQFAAGTAARSFAEEFGGAHVPQFAFREVPTVISGQKQFIRGGRELPFFELNDDLLEQIKGRQTFEEEGALRRRVSELEAIERERQLLGQERKLLL